MRGSSRIADPEDAAAHAAGCRPRVTRRLRPGCGAFPTPYDQLMPPLRRTERAALADLLSSSGRTRRRSPATGPPATWPPTWSCGSAGSTRRPASRCRGWPGTWTRCRSRPRGAPTPTWSPTCAAVRRRGRRSPSPQWTSCSTPTEFFVHHEDVRRAQPGRQASGAPQTGAGRVVAGRPRPRPVRVPLGRLRCRAGPPRWGLGHRPQRRPGSRADRRAAGAAALPVRAQGARRRRADRPQAARRCLAGTDLDVTATISCRGHRSIAPPPAISSRSFVHRVHFR